MSAPSGRPLVRRQPWELDRWRDVLRQRVVNARVDRPDGAVRVSAEPLLREVAPGDLRQSIRIDAEPPLAPGSVIRVVVRGRAAEPVEVGVEPGPAGSVRALVPAVDVATPIALDLPDLPEKPRIELVLPVVRHWTIHLIHHSHLDIGYTDVQSTVIREQASVLDSVLDLVRATDDWPEPARFRWCAEALWTVERWAATRPVRQVEALVERVREGRIELSAMPFNVHSEACSTAELHELLRGARDIRDRWGVPFVSAMQTDVPGAVTGLPDALGQVGVRYLSVAHNWAGRAVPHLVGGARVPRLFRWRGAGGHEVLVWLTDTPHGLAYAEGQLIGFGDSLEMVDDLLPPYLASLAAFGYPYVGELFGWAADDAPVDRLPYPYDLLHLRVIGRLADNTAPRLVMSEIVRDWNARWAWPHLRLSRNADFFEEAEVRFGEAIPALDGDWNDWWADGLGSAARPTAVQRTSQALATEAATVDSIAGLLGASPSGRDGGTRRGLWDALALFDEHTWGAADPWSDGDAGKDAGEHQWHWKAAQGLRAHDLASDALATASARLGGWFGPSTGSLASFIVVNTCGWTRSEVVSAFLPEAIVPRSIPVEVIDPRSGASLPLDVEDPENLLHRDAGRVLRFLVPDVPGIGVVRLDVIAGDVDAPSPTAPGATTDRTDPTTIANDHFTVHVDLARSCIASIVDRATGRELVADDAAIGFNGYVYDRYATIGGFNHGSSRLGSGDRLELLGSRRVAGPAVLVERTSRATGEQLAFTASADGARVITTRLSLPRGVARLDITNRLSKSATMAKESAFVAFPFRFADPTIRIDVAGGIVGSGVPAVPGGAPHMRAIRDWVAFEEDGYAIAWTTRDAPLVQIGQIALPYAPFPATLEPEPATVFSWVHNNIWDTNFPSQQGFDLPFRYSIAGGPVDDVGQGPVLGHRTAAGFSRPLIAILARGEGTAGSAEERLLVLEDARIELVDVIAPGPGLLLVRLRSLADEPVTARVRLSLKLARAQRATYLGDVAGDASLDDGEATIDLPARATGALLLTIEERPP